jgi:hypothetical protein
MKKSQKEQLEKRKAEAKRKKITKQILLAISTLAVLVAISYLVVANQKPKPGKSVEVMNNQNHIKSIDTSHEAYNTDPPTSGPHAENMANWGFSKEILPKELLVHNLEDGGIVIYYNKTINSEDIDKLSDLAGGYSEGVVVNSYPEMKNSITLTAWGRIDRLDSFDKKRITDFIAAFKGIDHH